MDAAFGYSMGQHGLPPRTSTSGSNYHTNCVESQNANNFQMMDVTVSVLGLTGILMQSKKLKENARENGGMLSASDSLSSASASASTHCSGEIGTPVTVLASFFKNVSNSETSIASHIPSLPLRAPSSDTINGKFRYIATWPTDFDPSGNELSTFKCARLMKKELISPEYLQREDNASPITVFVPERIQLTIGLRRCSEIITLGTATILITGEESDDTHVSLPISNSKKSEEQGEFRGKVKKTRSKLFGKSSSKKKKSFVKDPDQKYSLDDNCCLNVLIRATPCKNDVNQTVSPIDNSSCAIDYNSIPEAVQNKSDSEGKSREISEDNSSRVTRSRSRMTYSKSDNQYNVGKNTKSFERSLSRSKGAERAQRNRSSSRVSTQSIDHIVTGNYESVFKRKDYSGVPEAVQVSSGSDSGSGESSSRNKNSGKRSKSLSIARVPHSESDNQCENNGSSISRENEASSKQRNKSRSISNVDSYFIKHASKQESIDQVNNYNTVISNGQSSSELKAVNKERSSSLFGPSSIFSCGNMMNVLDNEGKVYTMNSLSKEPILVDANSDDDRSTIGMCYGEVGKAHTPQSIISRSGYTPNSIVYTGNDSMFDSDSDEETTTPDEYTCVTEPTKNLHEDKARSMIHNYANRVGVHPTKMI